MNRYFSILGLFRCGTIQMIMLGNTRPRTLLHLTLNVPEAHIERTKMIESTSIGRYRQSKYLENYLNRNLESSIKREHMHTYLVCLEINFSSFNREKNIHPPRNRDLLYCKQSLDSKT